MRKLFILLAVAALIAVGPASSVLHSVWSVFAPGVAYAGGGNSQGQNNQGGNNQGGNNQGQNTNRQ